MAEPPFPVPDRISSLMPPPQRRVLTEHKQRSVSNASRISEISTSSVESSASDFLAAKIEQLQDETSYIAAIKDGLDALKTRGDLTIAAYQRELAPYTSRIRSTNSTLRVLKRQRRVLEEDLDEAVETQKRHRTHSPPDEGLLERAYKDTIMARIMKAEGKQKASTFNQSRFRKDVNAYYSVISSSGILAWCHVLGMFIPKHYVKAAHIVPKSLDREELAHLFGDTDAVITLPQNGLSLHHTIESLLDRGDIVIVPMPGTMMSPTTWRCVVLNESLNDNVVFEMPHTEAQPRVITRVKDLDNRELRFLSDNRPRRRYLYLRFLISYLWCQRRDLPDLDRKVETRRFWPSAGAYLHRSTLQTLARAVSGCDIPQDLVGTQTFENSDDPAKDFVAGMVLAADLKDAQPRNPASFEHPDTLDALVETVKRL